MQWILWFGGVAAVITLAQEMPHGGWRRVLPILVWFAVLLPLAELLHTTATRVVGLLATFAGAALLRLWLIRQFPAQEHR